MGLIAALVLLVATAAIALPLLIDPNDYRDTIATKVEEQTGRTFRMDGDLSLTVFPWLGVETNAVSLANAEGFGPEPFAQVNRLAVRLRLWPLLSRKIEIGTVVVDGLRLRLERKASGEDNWSDLATGNEDNQGQPQTRQDETSQPQSDEPAFSIDRLSIGAVEVTDAAITWLDSQAGQELRLDNFSLRTGRVQVGDPVNVNSSFNVSVGKPAVQAKVDVLGNVLVDLKEQGHRVDGLQIDILATGDTVPGGKQQLTAKANLTSDLESGVFNIADLVVQAAGVTVNGSINGTGLNTGQPAFNGSIAAPRFNPRSVMRALALDAPETRQAALDSAELDARFAGTPDSVSLKQIKAKLDDSTLTGTASVSHFSKPAIAFDLGIDTLDADRYMAPASGDDAGDSDADPAGDDADINAIEIPTEALRGLNVDGKLTVGELTASGLTFEDAVLTIRGKPGQPLQQTLTARGYGGDIEMTNRVDAAGQPSYSAQGTLDQILAGVLLKDLMDTDWLAGTGLVSYDLQSRGKTVGDIRKNLGGTVRFNLADGAIKGIDVGALLRTAEARLSGQQADAAKGGETRFNAFGGTLNIDQGVVRNRDLKASNEQFDLAGEGSINLVSLTMDYVLKPTLKQAPSGGKLERLVGLPVPIKLSGPVTSPGISIDVKSLLKSQVDSRIEEEKTELRNKVEEEKQRAKDKLRDKAGEALRGLFGGGSKPSDDKAAGDQAADEQQDGSG